MLHHTTCYLVYLACAIACRYLNCNYKSLHALDWHMPERACILTSSYYTLGPLKGGFYDSTHCMTFSIVCNLVYSPSQFLPLAVSLYPAIQLQVTPPVISVHV